MIAPSIFVKIFIRMEHQMINIAAAIENFKYYVNQFNLKMPKINYKYHHSLSTMKKAEKIAKSLRLSQDQIELASLIGLIHDIGRFYQIEISDTFRDTNDNDHANYGITYLFDENHIIDYIDTRDYDDVIKKAIYYHNKHSLPKDLSEIEKLHCQIIRDADKLDIFYQLAHKKINHFNFKPIKKEHIDALIYRSFLTPKLFKIKAKMNTIENSLVVYNFVYDLNFDYTRQQILEKNYINKIYHINHRFINYKANRQIKQIVNIANQFLQKSIKGETN